MAELKSRETDARDEKINQLQKALAQTALNLEISKEINRFTRGTRAFGIREVDEVGCGVSASLNRVVPLPRVCTMTGVARSSVFCSSCGCMVSTSTRMGRGAKPWPSDDELVIHIQQVLAPTPFLG